MNVSETITVEIKLNVSGKYVPAVPEQGPTYDCGGEPAVPACFEDVAIDGVTIEVNKGGKWQEVDLIEKGNDSLSEFLDRLRDALDDELQDFLFDARPDDE